jgi:hypothetical protein
LYNEDGNLIACHITNEDKDNFFSKILEYDNDKLITVKEIRYDNSGKLYDEKTQQINGNIISDAVQVDGVFLPFVTTNMIEKELYWITHHDDRAYQIFCVNGKISLERNPFFSELNGELV